jgi:1-acyl-sn-glycerol-3-phosphate acyltransferase
MKLLQILKDQLAPYRLPPAESKRLLQALRKRYDGVQDPWGFNLKDALQTLEWVYPLYKHYFRVRVFGDEHIQDRPYLFISNHTGQIAFDAMLIGVALATEVKPPRVIRAMIERWMASLPFVAEFSAHSGSILGDRKNCQYLLEQGESILIFPEGVRGVSKNTKDFYQLQGFTTGFLKMALARNTPILPCAVIGAEEAYPFIYHPRKLAKSLGLPALPLSPFLLLGPLGVLPLPSPVDIYFSRPLSLAPHLTQQSSESEWQEEANRFAKIIKGLIEKGLAKRRPFLEKVGLEDKRSLK